MQAQEEKEAQRKRKEALQREFEQKRARVNREKNNINEGRIKSVRKYEGGVMKVSSEMREESKQRSFLLNEMKEKEIANN